jgi:hypothetical protein
MVAKVVDTGPKEPCIGLKTVTTRFNQGPTRTVKPRKILDLTGIGWTKTFSSIEKHYQAVLTATKDSWTCFRLQSLIRKTKGEIRR